MQPARESMRYGGHEYYHMAKEKNKAKEGLWEIWWKQTEN